MIGVYAILRFSFCLKIRVNPDSKGVQRFIKLFVQNYTRKAFECTQST